MLVVYEPNTKIKHSIFKTLKIVFWNIVHSRELIWQLFKRDFLMQYKKSFLGMTWIMISPIIGIVSWIFMNQTGILAPGDTGIPYPAYVLISSSMWGLFMGFYTSSSGTLSAGAGFIMQVKYPHEALLVKQIAQHLANFSITFVINIAVLVAFGVTPDWKIILFPILILPMMLLASALGLIISVISVVASDLNNITNILLGFVFYITPIIYSSDTRNGLLEKVIRYNPLSYLIGGVRDIIIFGEMKDLNIFLILSAVSLLIFIVTLRLFYISEDHVIERMI